MSQTGQRVRVRAGSSLANVGGATTATALFAGTLAQNAGLNVRVPLPEAIAAGRVGRCIIEGIQIASFDQLAWEFWFWRNQQFQAPNTNPTPEAYAGVWGFSSAALGQPGNGEQIGAAGLYYYYIDGLGIEYEDDDAGLTSVPVGLPLTASPQPVPAPGAFLNVTLVNRSAGAKTAGKWFDVTFIVQATQGW